VTVTLPTGARALHWVVLLVTLAGAVGVRAATDGAFETYTPRNAVQWVRSPEAMRRLSLGFDSLLADVYWIRAVQYYGGTKLSKDEDKSFDLLYPLLDITTSLDPLFNIAYRFGAVLLSEAYPNGAGRPDEAIALLEKGIERAPDRWEYPYDAGFVHYWWNDDYEAATEWFLKASRVPGAPEWLEPLAANTLAEGGTRAAARGMLTRLAEASEHQWIRDNARRSLQQLAALDAIDALRSLANDYYDEVGRFPSAWSDLVRTGRLPGVPLDPTGLPYTLEPASGIVDVSPESTLRPLPVERR